MPEPLAMPPTRNVRPPADASTADSLGNGSVVMIARAAAAPLAGDNCAGGVRDAALDVDHLQLDADDARGRDKDRRWGTLDGLGRPRRHHAGVLPAVGTRAGVRAAAVDHDRAGVAFGLRKVVAGQEHRRSLRQVRREDSGGARYGVGDEQRQVQVARGLDAARHAGGAEASRRRDAAVDRGEGHVRLECDVSHAGIASA